MASPSTIRSPYDVRVALVADTITSHSPLDADAARTLAVQILAAINSIPEKVR